MKGYFMEEGKVYKFAITGYDMNGLGVSKMDGVVVFIENALVDEVVLAKITSLHKKFAFAKTVKILTKANNRIESICPYSEVCGGCDLLHMDYATECQIKEAKVKNAFAKINNNYSFFIIHFS